MAKLKLGALDDDKPAKVSLELPRPSIATLSPTPIMLSRDSGQPVTDPAKLIAPMIEHFMATDPRR